MAAPGLRVCGSCRRRPVASQGAESTRTKKQLTDVAFDARSALIQSGADTVESLTEEYKHTVQNPQRWAQERWHLAIRVCRLMAAPDSAYTDIKHTAVAFSALKLTRQKLAKAWAHWSRAETKQEQLALFETVPKSMQIGKHGEGAMTNKQKGDLALWVRLREQVNKPLATTFVLISACIPRHVGNLNLCICLFVDQSFDERPRLRRN